VIYGISFSYSQRVVGYYPSWVQSSYDISQIDFGIYTHINHAFAWPNEEGEIESDVGLFDISVTDYVHNQNSKILLSLGGWGHANGFVNATSSHELRAITISNILDVIILFGYDGIDIDWEYPQSNEQKNNLNLFIMELDSVFLSIDPDLLITMALPTTNWSGQWYDISFLSQYIDFFNAMTYDIHGSWTNHAGHNSPLFQSPPGDSHGSVETGIYYLVNSRGIIPEKLNMGIPFWGKQYNASTINGSFSGNVIDLRYYEIVELINNGWVEHWDNNAQCPYLIKEDESQIITYDNPQSIQAKTNFAQSRNLGGIMVWALGYDSDDSELSLSNMIQSSWLDIQKGKNINKISEQILINSYPNPFNSQTQIEFSLPFKSNVQINIFNILGQNIQHLVKDEFTKGTHYIQLSQNKLLNNSSGIYFIQITTDQIVKSHKIVYLK